METFPTPSNVGLFGMLAIGSEKWSSVRKEFQAFGNNNIMSHSYISRFPYIKIWKQITANSFIVLLNIYASQKS